MKKNLLITLSSTALLIIAVSSYNYLTKKTTQITTEDQRVQYEKFINEHKFSQIRYTQEEIKGMPKRDRPDLAMEQDYLATMNPATGRPEKEKLFPVLAMTKSMQQNLQSSSPGNAGSPWVERGPDNVGGRTRALAWDPTTANKVWAGSVTGGLWYNNDITNAASSWQSVNDFWDNIAVTAIAFDPITPATIYIGTGEGWGGGGTSSRGAGIWKSTNGGISFSQIASSSGFYYIHDLVVRNEFGSSVVYAAVARQYYQGIYHGTGEGIQRSTNGGASWTNVLTDGTYCPTDIDISGNNTLFVGTDGGKIFSSTNGTIFTLRHNHGSAGRVNLACAPSDANYIYAAFEVGSKLGAFKQSTNGGGTWTTRSEPNDDDGGIPATDFTRNQAWYDLTLDVDPNNREVVMIGGIDIFRTANGGGVWSQSTHWYGGFGHQEVHADQHAIVYKPGSSTEVIFGNDGGVFYTNNGTNTTPTINSRINGYNVTQYYACAIHPTAGTNNFLAGAQDNGTQRYLSAGINSTTEATGGDGAFCFIDQTNGQYQFSSYVYNSWRRSTNSGVNFSSIQNDQNTGRFINPGDYDDNQDVLYSARNTSTIQRITSATGTFNISNFTVPGLGSMASHLSVSPYTTTSTTLFVGTGGGRVFRVTNAQGASSSVEITGGSFPTGNVSCIAIGASENELLVTFSNYGVNSIWYTSNGGTSWVSKEGDLSDMPVKWALFNPNNYNEVIVATEVGVWTTTGLNAGSPSWTTSNSGLANVRVDMLQMRTSDNEVLAATHGRGLFSSDGFNGSGSPLITWANQSADTTISCDASSLPANTGTPTATTTCGTGGLAVTSSDASIAGSCVNSSLLTRTWTATDNCGNSENFDQLITIQDIVNPTITCPANQIQIASNGTDTILLDYTTMATMSDNCSSNPNITVIQSPAIGSTQNIGTVNITLTATDECGNSANCNFDVVITGTSSITWTNQSANTTISCDASSLPANTGSSTATSTCGTGGLAITSSDASVVGSCANSSVLTRTWTATDNCGNSDNFDQVITIQDIVNPSITCPANKTQIAANGINTTLSDYTTLATISDNCSSNANINVTQSPAIGSTQAIGTVNVTLTATDECGNSNNCNFDVVISGSTYCTSNYTSAAGEFINNVTFNTIANTSGQDPNGYGDYTSQVTNLNLSTTHLINISINTAGSFTDHCWVYIDWNQNYDFNDAGEAYDLGDLTNSTTSSLATGITVPAGALLGNTRMRVNTEWNQNPGPCDADHTSEWGETEDYTLNILPLLPSITWTSQPVNTTISCDASNLPANTGNATATTTCSTGVLSVTSSDANATGICANTSAVTRTWTATDSCGNIETFDQIITIQDIINPTITCPANQAQTAANGVNTSLSSYTTIATVSDNCSNAANVTVTQSPAIGSSQNVGTVNITLTATDECGNSANCNFDVAITNTSAITWTNQPTNTTISCDASNLPANTGNATATTTCIAAGGVTISSSDTSTAGSCANASVIIRTWTAADNCGNTETFDQIITIQDIINPIITCPANQIQIASNGIDTILLDYTTMATISDNCSSNPNITVTQSPAIGSTQNVGTVNITLTATDECGNTSDCIFDVDITSTVGVADNTRVNISIFPNPNTGLFTIDLGTEMNGDITIKVYNLLGEVVYNEYKDSSNSAYKLNLQHVDKGIYFVSIKRDKNTIVKKIMIM